MDKNRWFEKPSASTEQSKKKLNSVQWPLKGQPTSNGIRFSNWRFSYFLHLLVCLCMCVYAQILNRNVFVYSTHDVNHRNQKTRRRRWKKENLSTSCIQADAKQFGFCVVYVLYECVCLWLLRLSFVVEMHIQHDVCVWIFFIFGYFFVQLFFLYSSRTFTANPTN